MTARAGPGRRHLLSSAYSLLANTALTSLLGMAFWVAAARLFASEEVGRDAVLISVMIELSTICQLNLGNGIVRFMPDLGPGAARALGWAYGVTGGVALTVGSAFVLLAPALSHEFAYLAGQATVAGAFVLALTLWGVFSLQDAALTATRRARWVPVENGLYGVLKLAVLPLSLALGVANGVFVAWVAPMAMLVIPTNILLFRRAIPAYMRRSHGVSAIARMGRPRVVRFLAQDYLASIFTQATLTALPLIVIATLGARASAYFLMPFTIVMAFDTFAYSACTALVAEAARDPSGLRVLTRLFLRRVLTLIVVAAALLALAAPLVLAPFGASYVHHGVTVLRLLLCASALRVVIALFAAVSRVQGRGVRLAAVELALLALVLGAAGALANPYGIDGVAAAWLAANAVICIPAGSMVVRFLHGRSRVEVTGPLTARPSPNPRAASPGSG
ncbi:MAG TPA: hypothetical protein VHY83_11940 [Solirubrobacteraceae bacterium]|nr:hypothetical protein [Solirubrobacteraceae bacterium]